jgi:hypothetical protein
MRFNQTNTLVWISEGAGITNISVARSCHQSTDLNGNFVNEFHLPSNLRITKKNKAREIIVF